MPVGEVADSPRRGHGFSPVIELRSIIDRLDLAQIFGRVAPLHVDLGCGDGRFMIELAGRHPEFNFLGIERLLGRVQSAARKIQTANRRAPHLQNVRLLRIEIGYAVRYLLPAASIDAFYLFFPDPWPKRRHQRRRLVNHEFLGAVADALTDDGVLQVATDQRDYFEAMKLAAADSALRQTAEGGAAELPLTKFETHFRAQGAPIYRLALRKVSPVR